MNYGKAVEEVWEWREALSKELESIPEKERVKYIHEKALDGCRKLGIKCRTEKRKNCHHA